LDELLQSLADWINAQPIQQAFAGTSWVVPGAQTIHIICVAIVISGALVLALRGMELTGGEQSLARWHSRFHGSTVAALWVLLATGVVLTITEPDRELMNWVFRVKMLTVIVTIIIFSVMGRWLRAAPAERPAGPGVRILALIVLLLWIGVAAAGRWIAYAG
jgi:hypothetical protein